RRKRSIASSTAPRKGTSTTCSARKCLRRPPRTELPAPHCAAWQARQNHTVGIGNLRRQPKREGCELEPGHTLLPSKNKFWRLCPHQGQDRWAEPGTHGREEHPGVQRCTPGALPTPRQAPTTKKPSVSAEAGRVEVGAGRRAHQSSVSSFSRSWSISRSTSSGSSGGAAPTLSRATAFGSTSTTLRRSTTSASVSCSRYSRSASSNSE